MHWFVADCDSEGADCSCFTVCIEEAAEATSGFPVWRQRFCGPVACIPLVISDLVTLCWCAIESLGTPVSLREERIEADTEGQMVSSVCRYHPMKLTLEDVWL